MWAVKKNNSVVHLYDSKQNLVADIEAKRGIFCDMLFPCRHYCATDPENYRKTLFLFGDCRATCRNGTCSVWSVGPYRE